MPEVGERLEKVQQGLTELSRRMDERFAQVDKRLTQLQVLGEKNTSQIKLVAEVQTHHGIVLEQIKEAVAPGGRQAPTLVQRDEISCPALGH